MPFLIQQEKRSINNREFWISFKHFHLDIYLRNTRVIELLRVGNGHIYIFFNYYTGNPCNVKAHFFKNIQISLPLIGTKLAFFICHIKERAIAMRIYMCEQNIQAAVCLVIVIARHNDIFAFAVSKRRMDVPLRAYICLVAVIAQVLVPLLKLLHDLLRIVRRAVI